MTSNIYDIAKGYVGVKEVPGAGNNPVIVQFFKDAGLEQFKNDSTSWCAAFVGSMLKKFGLEGTGSAWARSYTKWGDEVPLDEARQGDIVVLWRESPKSWKGHVGFYDSHTAKRVKILGGNQSNAVTIASYPRSRILSIRRVPEKDVHPPKEAGFSLLNFILNILKGVRK